MRQQGDKDDASAVVSLKVCLQDGYAVAYHGQLGRYGERIHPPAVFNLSNESWWDEGHTRWVTRDAWESELQSAKQLAAKMFAEAEDAPHQAFLIWTLDPKYAVDRSPGVITLNSEWATFRYTVIDNASRRDRDSFFKFRKLMLARNSFDHKQGLPFIHTEALSAIQESDLLPTRREIRIETGTLLATTWDEYKFRESSAAEIAETRGVLWSLRSHNTAD